MQPTTEILARISRNSLANKDEIFTRLYRYMLRPDLYFLAYKNLYANSGAATKGANDDTADGFSEAKIANIIQRLADETYQPTPARRTYIQKKNNPKKKRPLGIPTFTDKLVQEVLRMVLEAVYEPVFLPVSHGFRPKRSCHTALKSLKMEFGGSKLHRIIESEKTFEILRVYLKTVNTPKQRVFSACCAPFSLAIHKVFPRKNGFIRRKIPRCWSYFRFSDRP